MNSKNNLFFTKKRAFTLVELLIVIAIIGILFIVLITKVDFATNKSKASGVQTDFRSFQVAIESVAKEHAGLATFGWDTGDANGDKIRNSYDVGDENQNGIQDEGEVFIGSKVYSEDWTNIYTLTNPADNSDDSAIIALEEAINKNLDPKLHITIHDDYTITMANGAKDPWDTEYHGYYITNAEVDGKDRGAIVMYSNGANQEWGSDHSIAGGVVVVNVPGNNKIGKDDYGVSVIYTYVNGYGEVKTSTTGFSQNQGGGQAGSEGTFVPGGSGGGNLSDDVERHESGLPYDVVFVMEDSTGGFDGVGLLFSEDGTMDVLMPYWANEGEGIAMISMKTLYDVQSQLPAPKETSSQSNSNITTLVAAPPPDYSNDLFEYTLYDDGYFEGCVSVYGSDFELFGQYDRGTDCLYVDLDSDFTVVSEYYQKIESIRYDQTYYRAGEKNDDAPNTLLFKKDGSFYIDDVLQDYTISTESTAQFGFAMIEQPAPCSVPLVSGPAEPELVIYFASLDGTYITDGNNDYYLEDYSYEHIHDPEEMVGTSYAHSYLPCCGIYI